MTGDGDERQQLARLGLRYADIIESNGATVGAGIVRRLAAAVLTAPRQHPEDGCTGCGADLVQPATGRRRRWCSEACRSRTRRHHDRQPTGYGKVAV